MAQVSPNCDEIVAHLAGVRATVKDEAAEIATRARSSLAQHRDTGAAEITEGQGRIDAFVRLEDEAALSIEFGAFNVRAGRYVQGLYILTRAAGV